MSPELVILCRIRYGERWQTPLAREICDLVPNASLKAVLRTVQRWAAGENDPPPASEAAIRMLTQASE